MKLQQLMPQSVKMFGSNTIYQRSSSVAAALLVKILGLWFRFILVDRPLGKLNLHLNTFKIASSLMSYSPFVRSIFRILRLA
jgi:hypothetical protein